jgi:hypothetical protein
MGKDPRKRTIVRRVTVLRCRVPLRMGLIRDAIFDDVAVEDFRSGQLLVFSGAAFRHGVLKGRMPPMILNERISSPGISAECAQEPS